MFAYTVDLGDVGPGLQQLAIDVLFGLKGKPLGRQCQERRSPTRQQAEHLITGSQCLCYFENSGRRFQACLVRNGMGGFDDIDGMGVTAVTIGCDYGTAELRRPDLFDSCRHGGRAFARTNHQSPSIAGGLWQVSRQTVTWVSTGNSAVEQLFQKSGWIGIGVHRRFGTRVRPV